MEENSKENLIYGGLLYREDGWYKWWSDGNKHYTYEKLEEEYSNNPKNDKTKRNLAEVVK